MHVSVSTPYCSWSSLGRLSVPPWLLVVIDGSQTSVSVHCVSNVSDQPLCRLIVGIRELKNHDEVHDDDVC